MKKVGIISAGAWGTALGKIIAELGNEVVMWDFMTDVVDDINHNNTNGRYLLGVRLPSNLQATTDITLAAADKDFIIVATPSLYIIDSVKKIAAMPGVREGNTFIAVVTKGFISGEEESKLLIEAIEEFLPETYRNNLVYISGPSHAEEVSRGKLTGLIAACPNGRNAIRFRELLTGSTLMVFPSLDIVGVQTCGAVKNVVAIAFGMLDALKAESDKFGDNTESMLLAAGLNEIQAFGQALGATRIAQHHEGGRGIAHFLLAVGHLLQRRARSGLAHHQEARVLDVEGRGRLHRGGDQRLHVLGRQLVGRVELVGGNARRQRLLYVHACLSSLRVRHCASVPAR